MWKSTIPILMICLLASACASTHPRSMVINDEGLDVLETGGRNETALALTFYESGDYQRAGRAFVQSAKPGRGDREARLLTAAALCYLRAGDKNQFLDVAGRLAIVTEQIEPPFPSQTEFVLRVYERQIGNRQVSSEMTGLPVEIKQLLEGK